jgi:LysR family transcriptional activator of nhaA
MEWLNYHHLYYFWIVVKEGSITAACQQLRVAQPTVSAQIMALEEALGCKLFNRAGRRLSLTATGRMVYRDADEIFSLGQEMVNKLKERTPGAHRLRLNVGITGMIPKLLVSRLLLPATRGAEPISLVCHEGKHTDLLAKLAVYELDILLTDAPIGTQARIKAFNHLLGECGVSVFAARPIASKYLKDFPRSLHRAPVLLPLAPASLHRALINWFDEHNITPAIAGEFEDSALIKLFGQSGLGLFVMPTVEEQEVLRQYDVKVIGRLPGIKVRFYAISTERKVKNPAVLAITEAAHKSIFD